MSSSLAASVTAVTATTNGTGASSTGAATTGAASTIPSQTLLPHPIPSQFREIHKNTWLKRLTAEGKKITVGAKKSERSWVVFCVHDDTIALLEGYAEPRQTGAHMPEWIVSLQDTLHISHGLIPNSHEFEFVVTLSTEVIRFHAMSWDIMQEWVTTLRSKLREMKIISPRENLYTKLPEVRAPLLPTRDPTSPLPAPPPVPAAIVPGVERVIPQSSVAQQQQLSETTRPQASVSLTTGSSSTSNLAHNNSSSFPLASTSQNAAEYSHAATGSVTASTSNLVTHPTPSNIAASSSSSSSSTTAFSSSTPNITAMSNTLTQNLLNMLSDPISAYSEQINDSVSSIADLDSGSEDLNFSDDEFLSPVLRKSCAQLLQGCEAGLRLDAATLCQQRASADHIKNLENLLQCERLIPRPHTSRSQSVGAADKAKKQQEINRSSHSNDLAKAPIVTTTTHNRNQDNITELEVVSATTQLHLNNTSEENSEAAIATNTDTDSNITIIQVSTPAESENEQQSSKDVLESTMPPQLLPKKQLQADIFKFPEAATVVANQHEYKSNVQIIPSNSTDAAVNANGSSTIQVLTQDLKGSNTKPMAIVNTSTPSQYSQVNKKSNVTATAANGTTTIFATDDQKVTTVHVAGNESASVSIYGTCYTAAATTTSTAAATSSQQTIPATSTPKLPKKIILTANAAGITNITVNNNVSNNAGTSTSVADNNLHYDKVFLTSSIPISNSDSHNTSSTAMQRAKSPKQNSHRQQQATSSRHAGVAASSSCPPNSTLDSIEPAPAPLSPRRLATTQTKSNKTPNSPLLPVKSSNSTKPNTKTNSSPSHSVSPAMQRRRIVSPPTAVCSPNKQQPPVVTSRHTSSSRHPFLTRGLTEAAIVTRPSRKDLYNMKLANTSLKPINNAATVTLSNNNEEAMVQHRGGAAYHQQQPPLMHPLINRTNSELLEQRRRSSSTSDAQAQRAKTSHHSITNNNDLHGRATSNAMRIQQPPMPFRNVENGSGVGAVTAPNSVNNSPSAAGGKRMTLREQQVMQLRREIMHPGGVRLQLRRKDCVGSIAWVDAFGAVWVAGWKQKEHPVLYNALHIGDQLISITGINVSTAAEANKIIRNANTLFVEVLVRRIPFGRGYAIRREREGQCLGLIRDGNTSTIVDVVPNSLAARHGLPPKAQSCDGTTLTFWVLTEINGRPLNLFFKENEIRDRLNSVGRDISILVQPSDLITKLKKQLKSLRGYKDYLVQ